MIGVVIPAHNEAGCLARCLASVLAAGEALLPEPVFVVVVLDACTDDSDRIAQAFGVEALVVRARNVGVARAAGAQLCLEKGCRWLAFTDADSEVCPNWLADQLALESDAVCGTVAVSDWGAYGEAMQAHFAATYTDADGHRHIHGANMGVSAEAYRRAGGFAPLSCSEDVALVGALEKIGALIAWSAKPRVWTSARQDFRADGGFGATLMAVQAAWSS